MSVTYCNLRYCEGKVKLGMVVHKKTPAGLSIGEVRREDQRELRAIVKCCECELACVSRSWVLICWEVLMVMFD
jgi:hypothetical protein